MIKPIQGPLPQAFGISAADASGKDPLKVQMPEPAEEPERSGASKNQSVAEAKLQGNLRAAELNAAFKGELLGIEPALQSGDSNFFLPEVNDEVLTKKGR